MSSSNKNSKKGSGRLSITLAAPFLGCVMLGCFYGIEHHDVLTNRKEYWGGFPPGRVYELVQDVFCVRGELDSHYKYAEDPRDIRNPPQNYWLLTLSQYRNAGIDDKKVRIVAAGTRVRCSKITGYRSIEDSITTVYGVILDGPLAGEEVSFGGLVMADQDSPPQKLYGRLQPRPEFLRAVSPLDQTPPRK